MMPQVKGTLFKGLMLWVAVILVYGAVAPGSWLDRWVDEKLRTTQEGPAKP